MIHLYILNDEDLKSAFYRLFDSIVSYAKSILLSSENYEYKIHEARKSFKRLRSLLRIYKYAIDDDIYNELNTLFRDAGRQLAHFRDIDAISECLSKFEVKSENNIKLINWLKKQIDALRFDNYNHEINLAINNVIVDIEKSIEIKNNIILAQNLKSLTKKGIKKIYDKAKTLYYKNMIDDSDIMMHELRKKVKFLWDVALIFNTQDSEDIKFAEEIHTLSTLLGDYHDLVLTFDFIYNEKLIIDEDNFVKFKKVLYKRKDIILQNAFTQASYIFGKPTDIFVAELLTKFNNKHKN